MFKQILAKELKEKIQGGHQFLLLDVRQPYEHDEYALPNSVLIPLAELPERFGELQELKDQEIIVYCKAGVRSQMACKFLDANGFNKLFNLSDGILGW